jgi:preprotein translocase subunit Sec61beta
MKLQLDPKKVLSIGLTALVLLFALWLVSPFFRLDASDEANGKINGYRLALGLTVMILFVGKSLWDVLAPQGLAKKVSNAKAIALVGLTVVVMGFIVFTVARAAAYYLGSSIAVDSQQFLP